MDSIKKFFNYLKTTVINHKLALAGALLVGIIYVAPHLFFIFSLGDKYQRIPMMQTANEDFYIARIQEILDGHPLLGSFAFFEGKEQWPLTPPMGEMFYALPSWLFHISLVNILIASRFVWPFIIFIAIYFLIHKLTVNAGRLSNKINAIAGALLATLGCDFADYHAIWRYLTGELNGGYFLVWSRPVNPTMGAVFLFSFLLCLWLIIKQTKYQKTLVASAGVLLAFAVGNYFFSWGLGVSIIGLLLFIYLIEKQFKTVKSLASVLLLAAILTAPHWYFSWQLSKNSWYQEVMLRNGLFYTHYPVINKALVVVLALYILILIILFWRRKVWPLWAERVIDKARKTKLQDWHIFCLSLLLGGFWAFNQQILTGMAIWPFHFVQYTIPLAMIVICVLLYNIIKEKWPKIWLTIITIFIISSLSWGTYAQVKAYLTSDNHYAKQQSLNPVLNWLNQQPKDCVIYALDGEAENYNLIGLIPAFTHCNIYGSTWSYNLTDTNRARHSYFTLLRFKAVTADNIEEYLAKNEHEARSYLFSNWKGLYGLKQFPDFSDTLLQARIKKIPADYRQFIQEDFKTELNKYRLNYILSVGPLADKVTKQLPGLKLINQFSGLNIFIYSL